MVGGHFPLPPSFHPSPMEFGKARNWHWRRKMFEGPNGQYGLWNLRRQGRCLLGKLNLLFRCNGMGNDPFVDFPVWWAPRCWLWHYMQPLQRFTYHLGTGFTKSAETGFCWLGLWVLHCLPDSAWADGNLAEAAGELGKMVEHRNQSQPNPGLS